MKYHLTSGCALIEMNFLLHVGDARDQDEICDQLYMDKRGRGFNRKTKYPARKRVYRSIKSPYVEAGIRPPTFRQLSKYTDSGGKTWKIGGPKNLDRG